MESIPGEDPTLPLEVNSGFQMSREMRFATKWEAVEQITELRKENFNLKLRIYFLEDRIQQKFDGPHDDVYRINIELKVELESVKRELQQREQLLRKASRRELGPGWRCEIQRLKEDAEKKVQEDNLCEREKELSAEKKNALKRDKTIQGLTLVLKTKENEDLRNQLEKTQNELAEKEKAIELHYAVLLSDGGQRLQNQELVIARLTDGTLDGVIREKDLRLQEWSSKFQKLEKNKQSLERQNEALMEEKCKSSDINNLQEELNTILALRKQLEEGILETWNLRRTLEEQIRDNRKEDTPLSWSNQTSYMSICLRDQDHRWDCPVDQLSMEELKKKFVELLGVVKEMHWVIQELKKKPFDFSTSDPSANEKQKSLDTSEPKSKAFSSPFHQIIPLDSLDQPCKTLNPPEFESEPVAGKYFEGSPAANNGETREETSLPVCLLNETGEVEFGSRRQGDSKAANEPLDPQKIAGQNNLRNDLENKEEKDLKQLIIQLRAEVEQLIQAKVLLKQQGEPQLTPGHEDAETAGELNLETEWSKVEVKDTATQTMTRSGVVARPKHEGKRTAVSEDGAATQTSRFDQDCWQRYASRSLGSISLMTSLPRPDLQHCVFALDQGPKGRQLREEAHQSEAEGHGSIRKDVREEDKQAEASPIQPKVFEADLNLPGIQNAGQRDQDQSISKAIQLEKQHGDAAPLSSGGKGSPSLKQSVLSFDTFDCEAVNDIEDLRQRIRDLKSVVEKYQLLLIQFDLVEPCPPGNALDPVRSNRGRTPSPTEFKESEPEFASFSNEMELKEGVEDSSGSGPSNDQTVQKLRELLSENEAELEKEQMANMKLVDEVHRLHDKLKSLTPQDEPDFSTCPSLPEESRQRQKIHESHNICATYRQHLSNLIRAFEDLLRDSEVDYYVAESFREQLNQSAQIFERLEHQCLYGESIEDEMARLCSLAQRSDPGWKEKGGEGLIQPISGISSELLMEHLQEIRLLRQRLEDSIKTNDHLRKQLEQQVSVSVPDQDLANAGMRASEQLNTLTSEIHFLRKQNQTLNDMLAKGSREGLEAHLAEKQKENEALRESLTQEQLAVEGLQKDHEHLKEENKKLREQVGKGEVKNEGLTHEIYNMELATKQHQLSESDQLLCSLRVELKVYEKLDEALQNEKDRRQNGAEECRKDQNQPLDLGELLTEIQFLRKQLEQSITSNQMLHEKVEEQLRHEKAEKKNFLGPALQISYLFELSFSTLDSPSHCNLLTNKEICPVPSHCVWADKNGQHILGLIEDYNCLRKQITEGRKRLGKLELPLKEGEGLDSAVTVPLSSLSATFKAVQQNLEEAARLLNLLWRVSLPMKVVHAAAYSLQDESLKSEVYKLRRKVAEQEKKLYSMARRLYSTNQLKENMERVQPSDNKATPSSLIKKRV
ncbi:hypothetical protein E2320_006516 [Naja naja]|nr:hypothetical protein E2320_006516 [Naja naja]